MNDVIQIHPNDSVAVALRQLRKGETVKAGNGTVTVLEDIPRGHKVALRPIAKGEDVRKYGVAIGHAVADIPAGAHVHTHNMQTNLSGEVAYAYHPVDCRLAPRPAETFQGFLRKDGQAGIRNEVWILPTVGCVNDVARKLAADNQDLLQGTTVDGLYAFPHPYGCSQSGADHAQTRKLLAALARHPNAGAVLVLHLGCENLTHEQFAAELGDYDPERIRFLTCQQVEDEFAAGRKLLQECVAFAGQLRRQPLPASKLVVGLKCGGSDGLSGITANPAVGRFSDLLLAEGGSTILTEVPEMFGAESMLLDRCVSPEVFQKAAAMLNGFKDYFLSHGEPVGENPSPGNKAGGISTLEDKALGCTQKCGKSLVRGVMPYGERLQVKGLNLLSAPGNDLVASTALASCGCHMVLFTTGRGTPFGTYVPTMKISTNSTLYKNKPNWIDFNAGVIAEGEPMEQVAKRFADFVIDIANGTKTNNEKNGYHEIAIFKNGVTL